MSSLFLVAVSSQVYELIIPQIISESKPTLEELSKTRFNFPIAVYPHKVEFLPEVPVTTPPPDILVPGIAVPEPEAVNKRKGRPIFKKRKVQQRDSCVLPEKKLSTNDRIFMNLGIEPW
jgi:hypothetical protein